MIKTWYSVSQLVALTVSLCKVIHLGWLFKKIFIIFLLWSMNILKLFPIYRRQSLSFVARQDILEAARLPSHFTRVDSSFKSLGQLPRSEVHTSCRVYRDCCVICHSPQRLLREGLRTGIIQVRARSWINKRIIKGHSQLTVRH